MIVDIAIYDIIQIATPEFTLSSYEYKRRGYENRDRQMQCPSDEILTQQRLESYPLAIKTERRCASHSLTISTIILIINVVVFLVDWGIAPCKRNKNRYLTGSSIQQW
jgi:hypothetical protein